MFTTIPYLEREKETERHAHTHTTHTKKVVVYACVCAVCVEINSLFLEPSGKKERTPGARDKCVYSS